MLLQEAWATRADQGQASLPESLPQRLQQLLRLALD
jgi:hypothetical protein